MNSNKIYFRHGTMFSGKTLSLISAYKTYRYNGCDEFDIAVLKPSKDTRDESVIKSRMSTEVLKCYTFTEKDSIFDVFAKLVKERKISAYPVMFFIDEVQFCTIKQIEELHEISKYTPIMCYGLKTSYTGELFPSIAKLLALVEDVQEIKTICKMCNRKATHNLLIRSGKPTYNGDMVNIEGEKVEDKYMQVCREHFYNPKL